MLELNRRIMVHIVMRWDLQVFLRVRKGTLAFPMQVLTGTCSSLLEGEV